MLKIMILKSSLLLMAVSACVSANEYVPDVYEDDYVTIRSGVMESGKQPIHLGDQLTLSIEVDFNSSEVLVENLSEDIFRRNWGAEKGLSLTGPPVVTLDNQSGERSSMRAVYPFQIIDCPAELPACPGHKVYPLPVIAMGYQIIDAGGAVVNNKSVRFNSWPGTLVVTQVLPVDHEGLAEFSSYFPDGGYPGSLAYTERYTGGLWIAFAGGLLLLSSFAPMLFTRDKLPRRVEGSRKSGTRWENVLGLLQDEKRDIPDEEWSDLIRRCATWYCMDEYAFNPYTWLTIPDSGQSPSLQEFKPYFLDVLNQESIDKGHRAGFVLRFRQLAGLSGSAAQAR